ncbi:MAG: MFS transporter [Acholeplasmataceae bacterium]|nr:MFS transporter [Acholeplasmataceae bacterium]
MKLDYKKTFYVGLAFFIITIFWQTYDNIIARILIDKFGLNQTWSGVVMALDNMLAVFLLPLFGHLSDKTNSKRGRRTPYIIIGTIVAAFAFMALSFADNMQTNKVNATDVNDYHYGYAFDPDLTAEERESVAHWTVVIDRMETERQTTFADERITQTQFDKFEEEVLIPMQTILDEHEGEGRFSPKEFTPLKEFYYSYLSTRAWEVTISDPVTLIIFMGILLIALVAMSIFRSPAVALMPDVTMKPLRSKANAIINLMGSLSAIVALAILAVTKADKASYVSYTTVFISIGIIMLIILVAFLWKVKEPKLVEDKLAEDVKYGLVDEEEVVETTEQKELAKSKRLSLYLILFSVFLWFMGYNAVISKVADYAPKVLNMGAALSVMVAHGAAIISFIPIGIISSKIGRRKAILIGIVILAFSFLAVRFLNESVGFLMYIVFGLVGVGWATINVNSYPMVVELSKGSDVGKYTGYYYTFSMAAQIITPIFSGFLMDNLSGGRLVLFPYATIFVALAFITMLLVKHGDSKIEKKGILESFDVDMD